MVLQQKIGVRSVRLALGVLAGTVLIAGAVRAEEQQIQKVEITGSSIKRIAVEGALPVQRLSQEAIAKSGATNVADLIQALPAMQGFNIAATAAGSNSGGNVNASIHDIGASYTLVLLDGRRLAPQGSGNTVNLNAIPMSAVERVEILTDGASALYGSDAIAGVINFILKKNYRGVGAETTYTTPGDSRAGQSYSASLTVGFGNLEDDRFNVIASYRHDESAPLKATERGFAKTSYLPFSHNGQNYLFDRTSTAGTMPANVTVDFNQKNVDAVGFSPYLLKNGDCPAGHVVSSTNNGSTARNCGYNSGSTVEIVPQNKRDSFFTKATFKATDDIQLFTEVALTRFDLTARIAPNVVTFNVDPKSAYYTNYVLPYLSPAQLAAGVKSVIGNFRTYDWGTRDSQTVTDSSHFVVGAEGDIGAWSFGTGLTWSQNKFDERYSNGYPLKAEFTALLANPSFNPFLPTGQTSAAAKDLIANSQFTGSIRESSTTLKGIDAHGSRELFTLPGGKATIGLGGDLREYHYVQTPSDAAVAKLAYGLATPPAYDLSRKQYGVFAELNAPITKELEMTLAGRYDSFDAVENALAKRSLGDKMTANTYKVSARWQPAKTVLIRGSYGTGFKAPSMLDIGQPLVRAGVTASSYSCPFPGSEFCRPAKAAYDVVSGGNEGLKPERSKQYSIGFRVEPNASFSFGADLWDVKMTDAVSAVSEQLMFSNPEKYRSLFTTIDDISTGKVYWARKRLSINIGKTHNQGVDYDLVARHRYDFGNLTANLSGTYLMKSDYTMPGDDSTWTNSMNVFGINDAVSFRHLVRASVSLETGAFTNTLTANYRNGYDDALATVRNVATNKDETFRLHVPSYTTIDWQGRFMVSKTASIRAGIKNLLNREPPLSLRSSSGHQVGFDPRYADPMLRTFYVTGNYTF
ncbi:TonB-dependent receptor [Janthinobacterium sp. BJB412]|nr:TonB-dependent receptor [Janthinobacterium sp. BJB412]